MKAVILRDQVTDPSQPDEVDVMHQAEGVAGSLRELGHEPHVVEFTLDLARVRSDLLGLKPDFVFNLVESVGGQGRFIYFAPALLDAMKLPYTGARTDAMFTTSNKLLTKQMLRAAGLPTADWITLDDFNRSTLRRDRAFIIKSQWEDASIGVHGHNIIEPGAKFADRLRKALDEAQESIRGGIFAEAFVDGREFNLAMLENISPAKTPASKREPVALPPSEILFEDYPADKPRIVDYKAKWVEDSFEYTHTPRHFDFLETDAPLLDELKQIAVDCWRFFGLRGYARVDFRVDTKGRPWILEINANPCLSPDAGYAATAARANLSYTQVIERISRECTG